MTIELLSLASERTGCEAETLLGRLQGDAPVFLNSEYLDVRVAAIWGSLSIDARLIACLWVADLSDEDVARGEGSMR